MQAGQAVVRTVRVGEVLVLVLAHPPVNALSGAVRAGLAEGLSRALDDPDIRAVVIRGEGRGFSAGADVTEFGLPLSALRLGDLCRAIEGATKPVIAAIHGMALGGGLELAMAAHYRVAAEGSVLGLPEVNLGLVPGAGGTQRLPRLVGARVALRMMLSGVPVSAADALGLGLVDLVVADRLTEAALAMASEVPALRPTGDLPVGTSDLAGYFAAVAGARAAQAGSRLPAPGRIVDLVEAAVLFPLQQGLMAEEIAFADLVATPEAAGLRHAFFAERKAMRLPPAAAAIAVKPIATLGVWGVTDGVVDLIGQALSTGMRVELASYNRPALVQALEDIAAWQDRAVKAGAMTQEACDADWARLLTSVTPDRLAGAEVILRAGDAEPLPEALGQVPLATLGAAENGAALAITVASGRGGLAELGIGAAAAPGSVARLADLARRLQWRLVPVGPGGPVELGLRQALVAASDYLGDEGLSPDMVTAARAAFMATKGGALSKASARITAVLLAALGAEGARMLADGRARRPLEIDTVAILSGLVPRWTGGPMFQADQRGLLVFRRDLIALAERDLVFLPPELVDRLIAEGLGFASLNTNRAVSAG